MADKGFGVKEINLLGSSGTPSIDSPNDLNLNANTVAISTTLTVGNKVEVSSGIITSTGSGIVTYYGDGQYLTGVTAETTGNLVGTGLSISGISTLGFTTITDNFVVSGVSTFGNNVTLEGVNILYLNDPGSQIYSSDTQLKLDTHSRDIELTTNTDGGVNGEIILSNGINTMTVSPGGVSVIGLTTFNSDVNVGSAITMQVSSGIISATKFFGDGSGLSGAGIGANGSVNTTGIITASAFSGFDYLQAPYGSTVNFTVTVDSKSNNRYSGGSGNAYYINGVEAPVLTLTPGRTYRFNLSASDMSNHPFKFYRETDTSTTEYTTDVTSTSTYREITITDTTPNVLHYMCSSHALMGNSIITNSNVVDSPYPATLSDGLNVTGISSVGTGITMFGATGIISAVRYYGDGSQLTGIDADAIGDLSHLKVIGITTLAGNIELGDTSADQINVPGRFISGLHPLGDDSYDLGTAGAYWKNLYLTGKVTAEEVSIGGTLTYEDVTNVDSLGIITARSGIEIGVNGVGGTISGSGNVEFAGFSTFNSEVSVGSAITMGSASGIISATQFHGDGSQLSGLGGGTSPGQVAFASTAGISTLTSSWTVVPDGSDHFEFTGPGNLSSADDPTIYLQRGQIYEFVINSNSSHPFQIRKTDNSAYTDGVTYTGSGGTNSIYDGTVRFDVPFDAPAELKYVCTNHPDDMNGTIYVTDAAGQGGPTDVADFQNLNVSVASTLGSVEVSSGVVTAVSGIVTYYGDGQYLTGITAQGTGAIGGLTVKKEDGSTVGTAGSIATLDFTGSSGVTVTATSGAAGIATIKVNPVDDQENVYFGTTAGNASDADTCYNVAIGYSAGAKLNAGDENVFLGCCAGTNATSGSNNVFLGSVVDVGAVTGSHNVAIGNNLLGNLTSGTKSVAIGYGLLNSNSTIASCNIAIGADSMLGVDSTAERNISLGFNNLNNFLIKGDDNIAIGYCAGIAYCNTCHTNIAIGHSVGNCAGSYNISMGKHVGESYTSANHNIGLGWCILPVATEGNYNIAFGSCAGKSLIDGGCNIAMGMIAGCSVTSGKNNILLGRAAGDCITSGSCNVVIGCGADVSLSGGDKQLVIAVGGNCWISGNSDFDVVLAGVTTISSATGIVSANKYCGDGSALTGTKFNPDVDNNLFAGVGAGGTYNGSSTTCYNVALGYEAMGGMIENTPSTTHNVVLGCCAGFNLCCGDDNFLGGYQAGKGLTSGGCNIFLGRSAGRCQNTTTGNIYLGQCAGHQSTGAGIGGDYNVAIGHKAASSRCGGESSTFNIALGYCAGYNGKGSSNIALGNKALFGSIFCGCYNIGIGNSTGYCLDDGLDNIILGRCAGYIIEDGSDNVTIGRSAGYNIRDADDNVFIGERAGVWTCNGCRNVMLGGNAGGSETRSSYSTGNYNQFIGYCAGAFTCAGIANVFLGPFVGANNVSGSYNIGIGVEVCLPDTTGSCQLAIGVGADNRWITGDNSFNVTLAGIATVSSATGIVSATKFCGDGSALSGVVAQADLGSLANIKVTGVSTFLGSVGIGTTNSNHYNLRVDAGAAKSAFQVVGSTGTLLDVVNDATSDIFSANDISGINAFKINKDRLITMALVGAGDSVGIGTTLPRSSSKLDVEGIVKATSYLGDGSTLDNVGFTPDSRCNLFAGCGVGGTVGAGTDKNIVMGFCSGYNLNGAIGNIFMGCCVGANASGNYNIAFGRMSGHCLTSGGGNILMGSGSGQCITTGDRNILMGTGNFDVQTGADYNIGIGFENATVNDVSGEYNVLLGTQNARRITSGCCNTIIGQCNGDCLSTGFSNVIIGNKNVHQSVLTGCCNVVLGQLAGASLTSGNTNVFIGKESGKNFSTGSANIVIGPAACLAGTATGSANIILGQYTARCLNSGASHNIALGEYALGSMNNTSIEGSHNIAIGYIALPNVNDGQLNIGLGKCAGQATTDGCNNIFLGCYSGKNVTTGSRNIAIGKNTDVGSATGNDQLVIGCGASSWIAGDSSFNVTLAGIATVSSATGIVSATKFCGDGSALTGLAGFSPDSYENLVAGTDAGKCLSSNDTCNVLIGYNAGCNIGDSTDDDQNVMIGFNAGKASKGSNYEVYIGSNAGCAGDGTAREENVFIGRYAGSTNCGGCANVYLGRGAGQQRASGNYNVIFGKCAGQCGRGTDNIFIGREAGRGTCNTCTAADNVIIGNNAGCAITSGSANVLTGLNAGKQQTTASCNTITGANAGSNGAITGNYNNLYGSCAGYNLTSGMRNNAFGNGALYGLTTGRCNIGIGPLAGYVLTEGCANVVIGYAAGCKISTGNDNIAIGNGALNTGTVTGDGNIALGVGAAKNVTSGLCNIAIGMGAMCTATDGCCNVTIGIRAGRCLTSGNDNVFLGFYAGENTTTGDENVYIGKSSGPFTNDGTGDHNVTIGKSPGIELSSGCCNVFIGYKTAQGNTTGYANVYLGACAGPISGTDSSGYYNFATGWRAFCSVTSGRNNIVMGTFAGRKITTGKYNIVFGEEAMTGSNCGNMTGEHNFTTGKASMNNATTANNNFVAGHYAGSKFMCNCHSIAIGEYAQQNRKNSFHNIALGAYSLQSGGNGDDGTGGCNVAIGGCAGKSVCSGANNILMGWKSGCDIDTGSMNIMIGCNVDGSGAGVDKEIVLGFDSSAVAKGTRTFYVQADAGVYHGGNTASWTTTSDLRIKKNVTDNNTGLDKIKDIQVRNFEYRTKDEITDFENPNAVVVDKEGLQLGVIAQEIQKVLPDTVTQQSTGALGVNADNLTWYLINAVKELSAKNDALEERIKKLEGS